MGNDNDGGAGSVQIKEHAHDPLSRIRIQRTGWLIGEQQRRLTHDGPRNRSALLFSARHLMGTMGQPVTKPHLPQRHFGAFLSLLAGHTGVKQAIRHVVQRGNTWREMKVLKDEADTESAQGG